MEIRIIRGDITVQKTAAIVNAANSSLMGGGGVDGAIHRKGGKAILADCIKIRNRQGKCKTGEAVITGAGLLPTQHVIHTVGPVWNGGKKKEADKLALCYYNSLALADKYELTSLTFPNISTGIYGYPKAAAAKVALAAVRDYFDRNSSGIIEVVFVCFDQENYELYLGLLD